MLCSSLATCGTWQGRHVCGTSWLMHVGVGADLTAKAHADKYVAASNRVMARVESCYAGIKMPSSDVMFLHRAAA